MRLPVLLPSSICRACFCCIFIIFNSSAFSRLIHNNTGIFIDTLPPVITTLLPSSGATGTTVTINGSNFNSSPTGNIVYFGDTKATIITATATQITCIVPAGASNKPVSVLHADNGLSGRSFKPFAITFADSSDFSQHSFVSKYDIAFPASVFPLYSLTKDLDGDGKTDLINASSDSLSVFANNSLANQLSFGTRIDLMPTLVGSNGKFSTDDLDGDGKPDIVAVNGNASISIIKNNSTPGIFSFAPKQDLSCANNSFDIAIDDIDNDGRKDLIVGAFNGLTGVSVIRNNSTPGSLSFAAAFNTAADGYVQAIATGDLDGDGKTDVVTMNDDGNGGTSFSYLKNNSTPGNILFAAHQDIYLQGDPQQGHSILLSDLDNDNKLDVIITNSDNYYVILKNTSTPGNISFAPEITYSSISVAQGTSIAHLSGSIKPDMVVANWLNPSFTLFKNNSTAANIAFAAPVTLGSGSLYLTTGDIDGDGKTDIISTNGNQGSVSIYQNNIGGMIATTTCEDQNTSMIADVTGSSYQWQQDSGAGFVNIAGNAHLSGINTSTLSFIKTPASWNGFKYRCVADAGMYSSIFELNVHPKPTVSISADHGDTICGGTRVVFTATATNAGIQPKYQWQVNGLNKGIDSSAFVIDALKNKDTVRVIISVSAGCATPMIDTSNILPITVTGTTTTISISTADSIICAGKQVGFTSAIVNGGAHPTYQWQVNGINRGSNNTVFSSDTLHEGDIVRLVVTNDPVCGTPVQVISNSIRMHVSAFTTPFDSIYVSNPIDSSFCEGNEITFSSIIRNAGSSSAYQWQVNAANAGSNSAVFKSASLKNSDQVRMILVTHGGCSTKDTAISNSVTVMIKPFITPGISIAGITTVASGGSLNVVANIVNGGANALYNWQDSTNIHTWQNIAGGTNPTIMYSPLTNGDALKCILTSNAKCATAIKTNSNILVFNVSTVTAINSVPAEHLGIHYYPNPAVSVLHIEDLKLVDQWETFSITSLNGREAFLSKDIRGLTRLDVQIEQLAAGYYMGVLKRKKGVMVYIRFIKQ